MTAFGWCVAGRESTWDFQIDTGNGYYGGFQFEISTWLSVLSKMGVTGWPSNPAQATPAQQTAAFTYWYARDPGAWPVTGPACGGP